MKSIVKKAVTGLVASAALVGAVAAAPAEARGYYRGGGYGYHHYYRGGHGIGRGGAAVLGGIAGLAVGAAISSTHYGYGGGYGYRGGYDYAPPAYYGGGGYGYGGGYYQNCRSSGVYDPYIGRYVQTQTCY